MRLTSSVAQVSVTAEPVLLTGCFEVKTIYNYNSLKPLKTISDSNNNSAS